MLLPSLSAILGSSRLRSQSNHVPGAEVLTAYSSEVLVSCPACHSLLERRSFSNAFANFHRSLRRQTLMPPDLTLSSKSSDPE